MRASTSRLIWLISWPMAGRSAFGHLAHPAHDFRQFAGAAEHAHAHRLDLLFAGAVAQLRHRAARISSSCSLIVSSSGLYARRRVPACARRLTAPARVQQTKDQTKDHVDASATWSSVSRCGLLIDRRRPRLYAALAPSALLGRAHQFGKQAGRAPARAPPSFLRSTSTPAFFSPSISGCSLDAVLARERIDPRDPERAEVALLLLAIAIGIGQALSRVLRACR